jgi:hypothetical protein
MKKALIALMMLTACDGESIHEVDVVNADEPSTDIDPSCSIPDCGEPVIEVVADPDVQQQTSSPEPQPQVTAIPVALAAPQQARTPVQLAPSFHDMRMFSELPHERRAARALFSRTEPEEFNLRGNRELRELTVLVFSRLCVSEANWVHDDRLDHRHPDQNHAERDCPAIYRVLRRTRRTGQTLIGIMREHSRYSTEEWAPRGPRTRWIVQLQLNDRRPTNFPATDSEGRPLNWERDYLPRWQAVQALTRRLLAGRDLGPCANAPIIAWGGRCDDEGGACDDHIAERRGLVPYDCGETANRFWCRPGTPGCQPETMTTETSG